MLQAAGRGKATRAAFTERQARQIAAAYYKLFSEAWPYSARRLARRLNPKPNWSRAKRAFRHSGKKHLGLNSKVRVKSA